MAVTVVAAEIAIRKANPMAGNDHGCGVSADGRSEPPERLWDSTLLGQFAIIGSFNGTLINLFQTSI